MKKIIIITTGDSLSGIACRKIFEESAKGKFIISALVNSSISFKKSKRIALTGIKKGSLFYVVYIFTEVYFLKIILLFSSFHDFFIGKKRYFFNMFSYCRKGNIPVITAGDINADDCISKIKMHKPDLILSIRPSQIYKEKFIGSFPRILNLHCTLLPKYRGIGGIFQALLHDETELGYTVHTIDSEEIDSGLITSQDKLTINGSWSLLRCTIELYRASQDLLLKALNSEAAKDNVPSGQSSYFSWPTKDDFNKFLSKGKKFLSLSDLLL